MTIIEDSNQKIGEHITKNEYFAENDVTVLRTRLPYGDYALAPKISIDTKRNMAEIAGNIGGSSEEHKRFINECKRARDAGAKLYFLIENEEGIKTIEDVARWQNPRRFVSPKCIDGVRLSKAMNTIQERYGCTFLFCTEYEAGRVIMELLKEEGNDKS